MVFFSTPYPPAAENPMKLAKVSQTTQTCQGIEIILKMACADIFSWWFLSESSQLSIQICHNITGGKGGGGLPQSPFIITILHRGEGFFGTPNLYYVKNGLPLKWINSPSIVLKISRIHGPLIRDTPKYVSALWLYPPSNITCPLQMDSKCVTPLCDFARSRSFTYCDIDTDLYRISTQIFTSTQICAFAATQICALV